jgi:hypothetical protein
MGVRMGLIGKVLGGANAIAELGNAVENVAEVFTPNATKNMVMGHEAFVAALSQYGVEFQAVREGKFDRFVNGLNRLPRPALAIGTLGLFVYAMAAPNSFAERMIGLALVPEPLWWLLGAVVSFYFGAREMYHARNNRPVLRLAEDPSQQPENPALAEWVGQGER